MIVRRGFGNKRPFGRRPALRVGAALLLLAGSRGAFGSGPPDWPQWGRNPEHTGAASVVGQRLEAILADVLYDPFAVREEQDSDGELLAHYAVPLIDGPDVYMAFKSGDYLGFGTWDEIVWSVKKLEWRNGSLVEAWTFDSDWKPVSTLLSGGWEPVFHPVLAGDFVYVPGVGGTVHRVSKATGLSVGRLNPFDGVDATRYVAGGLAAAPDGAVIYNAVETANGYPIRSGALVRIAPNGKAAKADFASLVPGAPGATALCVANFSRDERPWPPSPTAVPPSFPCGPQRPGINVIPAVAPDGTIYTLSVADQNLRYGYLVAVRPDLTPAWSASLRGILDDGCGVSLPPNGTAGGCREGTARGVDPATNERPAGIVADAGTSSPVVLPDGAVLIGAYTGYNFARGHLFKFSSSGDALATYDFGWDITPAVWEHDGAYSVLLKDNHYPFRAYCGDGDCPAETPRYDLVSLDADLVPEWTFTNTTDESCTRQAGEVVCVPAAQAGFEWCVNQPAVDSTGVVYANSEDGSLYAVEPGGRLRESIFLDSALGAAYTPVALGPDGLVYTQNNGRLFAVGLARPPRDPLHRIEADHHPVVVGRE